MHRYEVVQENRRLQFTESRGQSVSTALAWAREHPAPVTISSPCWIFGTAGNHQRDHLMIHASDRHAHIEGLLVRADIYYGVDSGNPDPDGGLPLAWAA